MRIYQQVSLAALCGLAALSLNSCQAVMQSMWTPRTPLPGEVKIQTPATLVSTSTGLKLVNKGSVHVSSTFCKFCTDAGKTYRGDMMPLLISQPSVSGDFLESANELPYRKGQKGILVVGSQSGVVHSFVPYEHMGKIENNRRSRELPASAGSAPVLGF